MVGQSKSYNISVSGVNCKELMIDKQGHQFCFLIPMKKLKNMDLFTMGFYISQSTALPCHTHFTLYVNFFLSKVTKQRSVIDKTVAKLKTSGEMVVCCWVSMWGWGLGIRGVLRLGWLASLGGGALDAL